MKKIFALGFGILMLASCSSDDAGSSVQESQLTNKKWYYSKYVIKGIAMTHEHENIECGKDYSLFKDTGVFVDAYYESDCEEMITEDSWTLDGKKLSLNFDGEILTYTISKLTNATLEVTTKQDVDEDGKLDTVKMIFTAN
jgi:hypothetical protein